MQGITGRDGSFHAEQMIQYGTNVVGGVTPGKGGNTILGVPIFDSMQDAISSTQADVSLIFVPPAYASDAIIEAADAGIQLIVCITEGIPVNQMLKTQAYLATKPKVRLIGPNCPGVVSPGKAKLEYFLGIFSNKEMLAWFLEVEHLLMKSYMVLQRQASENQHASVLVEIPLLEQISLMFLPCSMKILKPNLLFLSEK